MDFVRNACMDEMIYVQLPRRFISLQNDPFSLPFQLQTLTRLVVITWKKITKYLTFPSMRSKIKESVFAKLSEKRSLFVSQKWSRSRFISWYLK